MKIKIKNKQLIISTIIVLITMYYTYILLMKTKGILVLDIVSYVALLLIFIDKVIMQKEKLNIFISFLFIFPLFIITNTNLQLFIRLIALLGLTIEYFLKILEDTLFEHSFLFVIITILDIFFIGTVGIYCFENVSLKESLWYTIVSATTVGYGDIVAKTTYGQIISVFTIMTGTIIMGAVLTTLILKNLQTKRGKKLQKRVTSMHENSKITMDRQMQQKIIINNFFNEFKKGDLNLNELEKKMMEVVEVEND